MKKILLGVCSIGNGHVNRQRLIINHLLNYDVQIVLAVTDNMHAYFKDLFPELAIVSINVPWIYCDNNGINFIKTKERYENEGEDQFNRFLMFSIDVQNLFDGCNPDLVMTDYEPNVAQFAYATNKPLICLDQHSKFLILPQEMINEFSINIEISRLLYFFPRADKRYVSSFFNIESSNMYNIEVLPPIVKNIKRASLIDIKKVVVYFSPYATNPQTYEKILALIKNYKDYEFHIYTELEFPDYKSYANLMFKKIGDAFNNDLYDCSFIISSAGHQLISEAINLNIPLYLFPLNTYDQNYCCYIVDKHGLGRRIVNCDQKEFDEFIANIDKYRCNMNEYKKKNWVGNWDEILFGKLEKDFGLKKSNRR